MVVMEAGVTLIHLIMCFLGGGITSKPAGTAEEGGRAERRVVPEPVTGDRKPEKQAGHCFCPLPDAGNAGGSGELTKFTATIVKRFSVVGWKVGTAISQMLIII